MPSRSELESWVCDALRAADGRVDTTAVRQHIWLTHENDLRAAGPQFFSWQIDVGHALSSLKRKGSVRRIRNPGSPECWEIVGDMTNAFEAMCRKASAENWCWNLGCTTCGNQDFRYGLTQIALGRHPASPEWDTFNTRAGDALDGASIRSIVGWPDDMKETLADALTGSSLKTIGRENKYPDWLGYMGVVLHMVGQDEEFAQHLTKGWLPELRSMVEPRSMGRERLQALRETREPLRWHHIDGLELHLRAEYRRPQP